MNNEYKLILNDITLNESLAFPNDFANYKHMVFLHLNHKGKYLFTDEILGRYYREVTLERVLLEEPDHFMQGANRRNGGKLETTWYDIQSQEEVLPTDDFFDFFFACKVRHLRLFEINNFLSGHLEYSFQGDKKKFFNFLNTCLNQQGNLLNSDIVLTVQEWMNSTNDTCKDEDEKIKGRPVREAGDHLTSLNLNQTALLIQLMQETRIIFKEEYLTYAQAGKAFNLLTGYSTHSIRQQLGTKGEVEGVKFEDYKELHQLLKQLLNKVEDKMPKR